LHYQCKDKSRDPFWSLGVKVHTIVANFDEVQERTEKVAQEAFKLVDENSRQPQSAQI